MKSTRPMIFNGNAWMPLEVLAPVIHVHREDPIPYEFPTARPYNPPVSCQVPTYDGSGKTTHPSVVDFAQEEGSSGSFGGFRFWMSHTPYPGGDVLLENPSIVVSNNGWDWHDPYGIENPVVAQPEPGTYYNADGELEWNPDKRRLELIWKHQELSDNATHYRHSYSYDGVTWSSSTKIEAAQGSEAPRWGWLSPAMTRVGPNDWRIIFSYMSGQETKMATYSAQTPAGPWIGPTQSAYNTDVFSAGEYVWHQDAVIGPDGTWWMVV